MSSWTEERIELLTKLWDQGFSASQIAKQLGGVTRNGVIGKLHRMGLSGRATPSTPVQRKPRKPRNALPSPLTKLLLEGEVHPEENEVMRVDPDPPIALQSGERVSTMTLRDSMCKWPIDDPDEPDFHYCGRPVHGRRQYCLGHAQMAFQPKQKGRRKTDDAEQALRQLAASRSIPY